MKQVARFIAKLIGYKVVAGFGDTVDFTYYRLTAAGAMELITLHPRICFVQVTNRYGVVVAERY